MSVKLGLDSWNAPTLYGAKRLEVVLVWEAVFLTVATTLCRFTDLASGSVAIGFDIHKSWHSDHTKCLVNFSLIKVNGHKKKSSWRNSVAHR
jgi:hypothetical protein